MLLRAALIGAAIAMAATVSASPANTVPAPTGPVDHAATAQLPLIESPPCDYTSTRTGECVEGVDGNPVGATAQCADGLYSHSVTRSGTCSHHQGVGEWCPCGSPPVSGVTGANPPAPTQPSLPTVRSNISQQQAETICRWLHDPAWTMGQIEMSTGDMLANDNPSFTGTPDILKAIAAAMSGTCPDAANQRPL